MRRVVIYRLGSLGDTVVALPCLHAVERAFPDAERTVLTNFPVSSKAAPLEAILGGSGLVQRFMAYPVGTRSIGTLLALRKELRALGADTLVYLTPSRGRPAAWRDLLYFRLCGFRRIVGVPLTRDLQHNRLEADGSVEPECVRLARCIAPLGTARLDDPADWGLRLSEAERLAGTRALSGHERTPRIAVNMGGKVAQNDWGEANWLALAARLRTRFGGHTVVFVGAQEDFARSERVGKLWPGPVVNLCGKVAPRVSAAAMAGARLFIGHDSGPLHLAACMQVTCVGLFGDNNAPRKWHPYLGRHRIIHSQTGIAQIDVERVAREVEAELSPAAEPVQPAGTEARPS